MKWNRLRVRQLLAKIRVLKSGALLRKRRGEPFDVKFVDIDERITGHSLPGYSSKTIISAVTAGTKEVIAGRKAYERDSVTFDNPEIYWPLWGALHASRTSSGPLRVLDYGGAIGSKFYQTIPFLCGMEVDWRVVEQPAFVEIGREITKDSRLTFFDSLDKALSQFLPNIIYAGSSIQYVAEPLRVLRMFAHSRANIVLIDRTPLTSGRPFSVIQEVQPSIYEGSYRMTVLNQSDVVKIFESEWNILTIQEVKSGPSSTVAGRNFTWSQVVFSRAHE